MPNNNTIKLWTTNVGSHVWKMNRPDSDIDLFTAYIISSKDILSGRNHGCGSHNYQSHSEDRVSHEIGKIINELIKGNINFLVGTLSDLVIWQRGTVLTDLKNIIEEYGKTKACTHSIRGLAIANYRKYIQNCNTDKKEMLLTKKCNTICRTLLFGINVLEGNGFHFEPVFNCTPSDVKIAIETFDKTVISSNLSEKTNPEPFREYLLSLRLKELRGEI